MCEYTYIYTVYNHDIGILQGGKHTWHWLSTTTILQNDTTLVHLKYIQSYHQYLHNPQADRVLEIRYDFTQPQNLQWINLDCLPVPHPTQDRYRVREEHQPIDKQNGNRLIDRYLMFYTPSKPQRVISGWKKMYPYHKSKFWFTIFRYTYSTVNDLRNLDLDRFEHPHLVEVVPNCLITFTDTHTVSRRAKSNPIPAGQLAERNIIMIFC